MNRRGFLKGLSALAVVPIALKDVVAKPELSNLEKARQIDQNFDSPFLYVQATEDLKQGDVVQFANSKTFPNARLVQNDLYVVESIKGGRNKAVGICNVDAKKDDWFFIQTVGHCKLPVREDNYFKKFGYE